MADGHFPTLVSATRDANSASNPLFSELTDGTNTASIDASGNLSVLVNNGAGASAVNIQDGGNSITVDGSVTVSATDLDIRDLSHTQDSVQIGDGTDLLGVNADGSINVTLVGTSFPSKTDDSAFTIATDAVSPIGALADETAPDSVDEGDVGLVRMTLDRKLLVRVVGATDANRLDIDASGNLGINDGGNSITVDDGGTTLSIDDGGGAITVDGSVTVSATDLDIRDLSHTQDSVAIGDGTDLLAIDASGRASVSLDAVTVTAVPISKDGSANSETNPIYVKTVNTVVSGSEIHDYDTASAVAGDATDNHDYTVAGTTFLLKKIILSSSGGSKVEVQTGPVASLATKAVGFIAKEGGTLQMEFNPPIEVPVTSTGTVRLIRTNRQGAAQDLYSTIIGNDVA
jgi:hypothetical protein